MGASTSKEPANFSEGIKGEVSTSTATDVAELDALYHDLPSYQPEPASETKEVEEMVVTKPNSLPTTLVGKMPLVSLTLPILTTTGLKVIPALRLRYWLLSHLFPK